MARWLLLVSTCLFTCIPLKAQPVITTAVGTDWLFPGDGRRAVDAPLGGGITGFGVAVDAAGNYFIADSGNNMVMRVGPDGILNVIAGNGVPDHSGDNGQATAAALLFARAIAFDRAGDLYVISSNTSITSELGHRIRKITRGGIITTVGGNDVEGYSGDGGPALSASLYYPYDLAIDGAGAIIIADTLNHRIRKISTNGIITTIAGNGLQGFSGDGGPATSASLNSPFGVALDATGNIYIADIGNFRIRRIDAGGTITTIAGGSISFDDGDPAGVIAPTAVEIDAMGAIYFADFLTNRVRKIAGGRVVTVAGNGEGGFSGDGGPALEARLNYPGSIAIDASSNVYVGDWSNSRIRRITPSGIINTVAGNGLFRSSGEGGPATSATLYLPQGSAVDRAGNLYISEPFRNRVRKISGGILTTFAGTDRGGYSGDGGPAAKAELFGPTGLAYDAATDSMLIADTLNFRIRKVSADGTITTVAGGGFYGDGGPATQADLNWPIAIATHGRELYIGDGGTSSNPAGQRGGRIRKVDAQGVITTIAGNGSEIFSGDGGPAVQAGLSEPEGLAVDAQGNVFVSDTENHRVRRIDSNGIVTTLAGTGLAGDSGDGGPAAGATLHGPHGLAFDAGGNLFITDSENNRVRAVLADDRRIIAVAGNGLGDYRGDGGVAVAASLYYPISVAVNASGDIFVADQVNHRARQIKATPPVLQIQPGPLTFTGNARAASPPAQSLRLLTGVPNVPYSATADTESGGPWLSVTPTTGAMPTTIAVTANPANLTSGTFRGRIRVSALLASPPAIDIPVEFQVAPALPPRLISQPESLTFSFTQGASASVQPLTVTNAGSGSVEVVVSATTSNGGNWLSAARPSATVVASTPGAAIEIRANPAGLAAGTYLGQIVLTSAQANLRVTTPVTMTVNAASQRMVVSPVGLTFVGVQNGGGVPPQTFSILNTGSGTLTWRVRVTEASGSVTWLTLGSESGTAGASFGGFNVEVRVNPASLTPGDYYGQIEITSPEAVNSPQFVTVFFSVLEPGRDPGPLVQPSGLVFRSTPQGSPSSQEIQVSNLGSGLISFRSSRAVAGSRNWFVHLPADATFSPQQSVRIVVQPQTANLPPGVYEGSLTLLFSNGTSRTVALLLVNSASGASSSFGSRTAEGCTPTKLLPVPTSVGLQSAVLAGWPNPLVVEVLDDCGDPLTEGSVVSEFSNNDAPVLLTSSRDGKWSGIWQIRSAGASEVTVRVKAAKPEANIEGTAQIKAPLRQSTDVPPVVQLGGVVSAASFAAQRPISSGGFISIFGARLADQLSVSNGLPFATELANTSVTIAGRRMPLHFTSDGQINALVPYGIAPNTTHQLVVKRGSRIATPEAVTVAAAQPGIFIKDEAGQGAIVDVQGRLVDASNPVTAGDAVLIFCEGLGPVNPPVAAGSAAPADPLARASGVTVTIGGVQAPVLFAGLAPGFAGLYQVNVLVPTGVTPGARAPVVITVADQQSVPAMIAVR